MTRTSRFGAAALAIALLLGLGLGLAGCSSLAEKPSTAVNLTGQWQLNTSLSDDPRKLAAAQREYWRPMARRPPVNSNDPMADVRTPFPAEVSSRGRAMSEFRDRRDAAMNALLWLDAALIDVDQSATALTISTEEASTRYVFGQKSVVSVPNGAADRLAGWKDRAFVVETRAPEGAQVQQQYTLGPDGRQLIVITEMGGDGPHVTIRRVYDRAGR